MKEQDLLVICFVAVLSIALRKILLADGGTVVVIQVIDGQDGNDGQILIRTYESIMPSRQWKAHVPPDGEISGKAMVPEISSCDAMESPAGSGKWIAILNGSKIKENHCSLAEILSTAKKSHFSAAILHSEKDLVISDALAKDDGIVPFEVIRESHAENLINYFSHNSGKDYLIKIVFFVPVDDKSKTQDAHNNAHVNDNSVSSTFLNYSLILVPMTFALMIIMCRDRIIVYRDWMKEVIIATLKLCKIWPATAETSPTNVNQGENNENMNQR